MDDYAREAQIVFREMTKGGIKWYTKEQVINYLKHWPARKEPKGWIRLEDFNKWQHDFLMRLKAKGIKIDGN